MPSMPLVQTALKLVAGSLLMDKTCLCLKEETLFNAELITPLLLVISVLRFTVLMLDPLEQDNVVIYVSITAISSWVIASLNLIPTPLLLHVALPALNSHLDNPQQLRVTVCIAVSTTLVSQL